MSSTITLQSVVQWAQTLTQLTPIIGVGGFNSEPALSICNNVIQEMIAKPYNWKFNSVDSTPFYTVASTYSSSTPPVPTPNCPNPTSGTPCLNQQDYPQNYTDIAWLEAANRVDNLSTSQPQPLDDLEVVRVLRPTSQLGVPQKLAWMYENNTGGIVRLWPMPDNSKQWQINFTYQRKVPVKQGLQETWFPFPDEMGWVYRKGFVAQAYKHAGMMDQYQAAQVEFKEAMAKEMGFLDSEGNAEGFQPDFGLFIG